jgi:small-conductance mechanosensitive channel
LSTKRNSVIILTKLHILKYTHKKEISMNINDVLSVLQSAMTNSIPYIINVGVFIVITFAGFIILKYVKQFVLKTLNQLENKYPKLPFEVLIKRLKQFKWLFLTAAIAIFTAKFFQLQENAKDLNIAWIYDIIYKLSFVIVVITLVGLIADVVSNFLQMLLEKSKDPEEEGNPMMEQLLASLTNIIIWVSGVLFILSHFGIDISTVMASIGLLGIAIAFAFQNLLKDLLASTTIYFDKPFKPGDIIKFDTSIGVVEKVGFKSTRIREMDGDELIIPNAKLIDENIRNFRRMKNRRVLFYATTTKQPEIETLKNLPSHIQDTIGAIENVKFDRCELTNIGSNGCQFEIVYFIHGNDHRLYKDTHQMVLLKMLELFTVYGVGLTTSEKGK